MCPRGVSEAPLGHTSILHAHELRAGTVAHLAHSFERRAGGHVGPRLGCSTSACHPKRNEERAVLDGFQNGPDPLHSARLCKRSPPPHQCAHLFAAVERMECARPLWLVCARSAPAPIPTWVKVCPPDGESSRREGCRGPAGDQHSAGAPWIRCLSDNQHYLTVSFKRKLAM